MMDGKSRLPTWYMAIMGTVVIIVVAVGDLLGLGETDLVQMVEADIKTKSTSTSHEMLTKLDLDLEGDVGLSTNIIAQGVVVVGTMGTGLLVILVLYLFDVYPFRKHTGEGDNNEGDKGENLSITDVIRRLVLQLVEPGLLNHPGTYMVTLKNGEEGSGEIQKIVWDYRWGNFGKAYPEIRETLEYVDKNQEGGHYSIYTHGSGEDCNEDTPDSVNGGEELRGINLRCKEDGNMVSKDDTLLYIDVPHLLDRLWKERDEDDYRIVTQMYVDILGEQVELVQEMIELTGVVPLDIREKTTTMLQMLVTDVTTVTTQLNEEKERIKEDRLRELTTQVGVGIQTINDRRRCNPVSTDKVTKYNLDDDINEYIESVSCKDDNID